WLTAMLRAFAELVRNVVSTLQMSWSTLTRDWHTHEDDPALPRETNDTIKETQSAAQHSSPTALILSSAQSARPSKDEGVLTHASHKLQQRAHSNYCAPPSLRSSRRKSGPRASRVIFVTGLRKQPWIPACAGMSGENLTAPNKNAAA
ncbi:MAG: hypothetical protein Q8R82_04830, partial [Hyphomonadaceae bacterium]|nr:hypothetical protein [Hyphomonadaceae bacterium]